MKTQTPSKIKSSVAAPKKTARRPPAATAPAADEIVEVTRRLDAVQLRATAVKLMASRRKDLEALVAANRQSFEGIQAVVKRQAELLKERIGEWRSVAKIMSICGPAESIAQLGELARQSFRLSLANLRELSELAVKTQSEAFEPVRSRVRQNLAEADALLDGE